MKKRSRESSEDRPVVPQSANCPPQGGFSFGFFPVDASSNGTASNEAEPLRKTAPTKGINGREARLATSGPQADASPGDTVRVMWEESTHRRLIVRRPVDGAITFTVKPEELAPFPAGSGEACLEGHVDTPTLLHLDTTFDPPASLTNGPWTPVPPPFEASLSSLVWPLSPQEFLRDVYGRRALAVHGTGERASELHGLLHMFSLEDMLASASKIVVWMKTLAGQMQYLESNADVATSCYRAGHSLYFNPSLELQASLLQPLARDLGMGFGATLDGGMGGDVEIFAVAGSHLTPWHLDGQENLTVQLRGCKRWSLCPSGLADPLTNYHPSTSHAPSRLRNRVLHRGYSQAPLTAPSDLRGVQTVVLRPGSFLYVPAGMWHRVESLGDHEEGSLSLNFSMDGARWGDVVLRCLLQPLLWGQGAARKRVGFQSPRQAREAVEEVVRGLREGLQGVVDSGVPILPEAVLRQGGQGARVVVGARGGGAEEEEEEEDDEEEEEGMDGGHGKRGDPSEALPSVSPAEVLVRNPLVTLVVRQEGEGEEGEGRGPQGRRRGRRKRKRIDGPSVEASVHWGAENDRAGGQVGLGGVTVVLEAPLCLRPVLQGLEGLGPGDAGVSVEGVVKGLVVEEGGQEKAELVMELFQVLLHYGFLVRQFGGAGGTAT